MSLGWRSGHGVAQDTGSPVSVSIVEAGSLGLAHSVWAAAPQWSMEQGAAGRGAGQGCHATLQWATRCVPCSLHSGGWGRLVRGTAARLQISVYFPGWKEACDPKALLCLARPLIHLQRKPMSAAPLCLPWAIALNLKGLGADFKGCSDKGCLNSTCVNNPWKTLWIISMKFSLNLLFFFSSSRKKWKSGKGGELEEGREGGKGWDKDRHFFLSANFSECQEVAWLRKKSLCYFHSFRNNLIRDLHVLKLLHTLNVRGHPCI